MPPIRPIENAVPLPEASALPPIGDPDALDQFRNSISRDDFSRIDTNRSGTLNQDELLSALQDNIYEPEQRAAIGELSRALENAPPLKSTVGGVEIQYAPEIPSWFNDGRAENLTVEERVERMEKAADKVTAGLTDDMNGYKAWDHMRKHQLTLQDMWNDALALDGDPRARLNDMLNSRLDGSGHHSGHKVAFHFPSESNSPKFPWLKDVDGYVTIDPKTDSKDPTREKWGAGVLGFNYKPQPAKEHYSMLPPPQ